jgi:nucleoside-triphosphatase THEP1
MIFLLSGPSGSGKSTASAALYKCLISEGVSVGGVHCPAVFENGRKTGIDAVMPGSGKSGVPLARVRAGFDPGSSRAGMSPGMDKRRIPVVNRDDPGRFSFGMWEFNAVALGEVDASVAAWLEDARTAAGAMKASGQVQIAIIDEIGPLELVHGIGFMRTLAALDAIAGSTGKEAPVCIVTSRPEITVILKGRWPEARSIDPLLSGGFDVDSIRKLVAAGA